MVGVPYMCIYVYSICIYLNYLQIQVSTFLLNSLYKASKYEAQTNDLFNISLIMIVNDKIMYIT